MKTENDIRIQYKRDTGIDALNFRQLKQEVEIETNELRYFELWELEEGRSISIKCKIEVDDEELISSVPYIQWLEEEILKLQ